MLKPDADIVHMPNSRTMLNKMAWFKSFWMNNRERAMARYVREDLGSSHILHDVAEYMQQPAQRHKTGMRARMSEGHYIWRQYIRPTTPSVIPALHELVLADYKQYHAAHQSYAQRALIQH